MSLQSVLEGFAPYLKRPICEALSRPTRAIILRGKLRSGKTTFLAHHLLRDRSPWYFRIFSPPYGLYLQGRLGAVNANSWLKEQLSTTENVSGLTVIRDVIDLRADTQPIRTFFHLNFPGRLPDILRPQPTFIVIDQAEGLIRTLGAPFLVELFELVKRARDEPHALQLIFVVTSDLAVQSLEALNGGVLFTVVDVPQPEVGEVERLLGKPTAAVYKEMGGSLGVAMDYVTTQPAGQTAAQYQKQREMSFMKKYGVKNPVDKDAIRRYVRRNDVLCN
jgi:hypothetical protein